MSISFPVPRGVAFARQWPSFVGGYRRGYRVLDRLVRGRCAGRRVVGHAGYGMEYDWSDYIERLMAYELMGEESFDLIDVLVRAGDRCLDAGAHIGSFAMRMAARAGANGRVVVVEAHPDSANRVRAQVALNGWADRVTVLEGALAERAGERLEFHLVEGRASDSALSALPGRTSRVVEVTTLTLDDAAAALDGPVRLMKMDVEGAEVGALRGGARWLASERRPEYALVEINELRLAALGASPREILDIFAAHNYTALERRNPGGWKIVSESGEGDAPCRDVLFVAKAARQEAETLLAIR